MVAIYDARPRSLASRQKLYFSLSLMFGLMPVLFAGPSYSIEFGPRRSFWRGIISRSLRMVSVDLRVGIRWRGRLYSSSLPRPRLENG